MEHIIYKYMYVLKNNINLIYILDFVIVLANWYLVKPFKGLILSGSALTHIMISSNNTPAVSLLHFDMVIDTYMWMAILEGSKIWFFTSNHCVPIFNHLDMTDFHACNSIRDIFFFITWHGYMYGKVQAIISNYFCLCLCDIIFCGSTTVNTVTPKKSI